MYLENIFKAPEIKKHLPLESDMFGKVNTFFVNHMAKVVKVARARPLITGNAKMLDELKTQNANLDVIQKKLQ
jgi:hypothetical protein